MAGERRFHAHGHRLFVARLAHHDDVRVGAQKGAHDQGEVDASLFVDLHLAQSLLGDFHRVFGGPDLGVGLVQKFQDAVQRGGLARTRGAADVEQTIGLAHRGFQPRLVVRGEAQLLQGNRLARRQNPHHHVFHTTCGRDGGHAQFDIQRAVFFELDLAVLGLAALGDVEVAHDLQARHHGLAEMRRHLHIGRQTAVHPKANAGLELARHGLDVDVGGLLVVGVDDDLVDELDQLVVGGGRLQRRVFVAAVVDRAAVHAGQQIVNGGGVYRGAK